ncbi:sodium-coupled neutral amino acid transporter 9 homolog isoform X2 [Anticarsia gemmatalis]
MSRAEASPLLGGAAPTNTYKTLSRDSLDSLGPAELTASAILSTYTKLEKSLKPERPKQSSLVTIFSVWNTIMGSSLLTMAWGVERAGLPAALILVAFMAALCLYTAYVLLRVNKHHGSDSCEVPALCRTLLGRWAEVLAHMFSLLVLLGANIVYWILITNFLYFTVNYFVDLHSSNTTEYNMTLLCPRHVNQSLLLAEPVEEVSPYWGLHSTVPMYVALIVFPLLNFRNVSFFTKFNSLGTLSVVYLLIFVLVKGYSWGIHLPPLDTRPVRNAAVLSGMLALSFYIHNIIITIMSNNARQDKNGRDLTIAFLLVTVTYTLVGAVFYICFPLAKSCIEDNILNNFDMHDIMTAVARILLLFQVVTVYPLVAYMLRTEAILLLPLKETRTLTIVINLSIMTMCVLVACFCPSIGTIIRYTGAVSGLVHVFALPSLLQVRSLQLRGRLTWWKTLFYAAIVAFGALNLLMQFFINE